MKGILYFFCFLTSLNIGYSQGTIVGYVIDASDGNGLANITVSMNHLSHGAISDNRGHFIIEDIPNGTYNLSISGVGYENRSLVVVINNNLIDLGKIELSRMSVGLIETETFAQYAIDRKTPTSFSVVRNGYIKDHALNRDFPYAMKMTPSLYAYNNSMGYGNSQLMLRGFNQRKIGVLINGIPVNDLNDGGFNLEDWTGLTDIAESIQVQRGMGVSPLGMGSIAGTINILTRAADRDKGGAVTAAVGNDGYKRLGVSFSSGKTENGWAFTFSGTKTWGNGYVDGTYIDAWSYFVTIAKEFNKNNMLELTVMGAPQKHGKRVLEFNMDDDREIYGTRHNFDNGVLNGKNQLVSESFSHAPQISLNHYWRMSESASLSTSIYYRMRRGGTTGVRGAINGQALPSLKKTPDGYVNWEEIRKYNRGVESIYGQNAPYEYALKAGIEAPPPSAIKEAFISGGYLNEGLIRTSMLRDYDEMGILSSFSQRFNQYLKLTSGIHGRYNRLEEYTKALDLLGSDFYFDQERRFNDDEASRDWVDYNRDGIQQVNEFGKLISAADLDGDAFYGKSTAENRIGETRSRVLSRTSLFSQLEFSTGIGMTAYFAGELSHKSNGFINEEFLSGLGGNLKLGLNYNLDPNHNVYLNFGFSTDQPWRLGQYGTFASTKLKNEKAYGGDLGYGYRLSHNIVARVNAYYYYLQDRETRVIGTGNDGLTYVTWMNGLNAVHRGIELDFSVDLFADKLHLQGMFSMNDWHYATNPSTILEFNGEDLGDIRLYARGLKVGNAPQISGGMLVSYYIGYGISADASYVHYDNLYTDLKPETLTDKNFGEMHPVKLPGYGLADLGITYRFNVFGLKSEFRASVHNLFDKTYIPNLTDRPGNEDLSSLSGFYGIGRTWTTRLKVEF